MRTRRFDSYLTLFTYALNIHREKLKYNATICRRLSSPLIWTLSDRQKIIIAIKKMIHIIFDANKNHII